MRLLRILAPDRCALELLREALAVAIGFSLIATFRHEPVEEKSHCRRCKACGASDYHAAALTFVRIPAKCCYPKVMHPLAPIRHHQHSVFPFHHWMQRSKIPPGAGSPMIMMIGPIGISKPKREIVTGTGLGG